MRSIERKKSLGEVFTPPELVKEMLDQLPQEVWQDPTKTFLDNSCGNGNFLVAVLERKIQQRHDPIQALETIYGVDIMQDNVDECRERLKQTFLQFAPNSKPYTANETTVDEILKTNIVCADALKYHYRFDGSPPYDKEEKSQIDEEEMGLEIKLIPEADTSKESLDLAGDELFD